MSLFGDSDTESPLPSTRVRKSPGLFGEEYGPVTRTGAAGLFADDDGDDELSGTRSPWDFPTPKKAERKRKGSMVRSLLAGEEVPGSYGEAFERLAEEGVVRVGAVRRLLQEQLGLSGLEVEKIEEVVGIAEKGDEGTVERGEWNVVAALVGLLQEGEDVAGLGLDAVDDRRRNLPQTTFPGLKREEPAPPPPLQEPHLDPAPVTRKPSFGLPESDPWGSPDMHRGHIHAAAGPQLNGNATSNGVPHGRTTSNITTSSVSSETQPTAHTDDRPSTVGEGGGWGSEGFSADLRGASFGAPSDGAVGNSNDPSGVGRSIGGGRVAGNGVEETVTVTAIPEKEGMFLFQHRNYQVTCIRRNSTVVRRYSDFVWLLDCLHKRYPFRQLPLLPPKRVAINGNYIAADASFVERRRRGLARFANALVRHPVLSQEQLVIMFLTVPTELAVWRKQATLNVQEEFVGKALPPDLEDSLPSNLQELFDQCRSGVKRSAEIYINLCALTERLAKRNEGIANDYSRFIQALQALTIASADTYAIDTNDVPLLNEGISATAKHMDASRTLLEDEAKAWDEGVLEDLKRQRDCLVSMRDLFDRRDRLDRDNIPALERRIENNERKLEQVRAKPAEAQRPNEKEKLEDAIFKDKQLIVQQHARGVFIKECIRDELVYFQQSQYHIARLHQDWSQERVKYAELQADNWRALSEQLESMPLGL